MSGGGQLKNEFLLGHTIFIYCLKCSPSGRSQWPGDKNKNNKNNKFLKIIIIQSWGGG